VDIFDSNIWIYALTRECDPAEQLVQDVLLGNRTVGMNAYIFEEVIQNLESADQPRELIDRAQTRFSEVVHGNINIDGPGRESVSKMDLTAARNRTDSQMLGEALGIQPKDVPIVAAAYVYRENFQSQPEQRINIYTTDRPFGQFTPSEYFAGIEMNYIDC